MASSYGNTRRYWLRPVRPWPSFLNKRRAVRGEDDAHQRLGDGLGVAHEASCRLVVHDGYGVVAVGECFPDDCWLRPFELGTLKHFGAYAVLLRYRWEV